MATLKDIAHKTGVSPTVVSLVLNGKKGGRSRVRPEKRDHIIKVAKELEYYPNLKARALATNRNRSIGFLVSAGIQPESVHAQVSYYQALKGVEAACAKYKYHCLCSHCDLENIDNFIDPRAVRDRSVDGVVLSGYTRRQVVEKLASRGVQCVLATSNVDPGTPVDRFYADLIPGIKTACRHLADMGHKRFMMIMSMCPGAVEIVEKVQELQQEMPGIAIDVRYTSLPGSTYDSVVRLGEDILDMPELPTAYFCDLVQSEALGDVFAGAGLRCPQDYSIFVASHCVDQQRIRHNGVRISRIELPIEKVSYSAAEHLIQSLEGMLPEHNEGSVVTPVPCTVHWGESCGPAPGRCRTW